MQSFSMLYQVHKADFGIKAGLMLLVLLFTGLSGGAQTVNVPQSETYSFAPPDSEFVMQVARINNEVVISLAFSDSLVFDYVAIERRAEFNAEFSQCKYIAYSELKTGGRHIVKKDRYAYSGANDVAYRLKLVTKDGGVRTYPAIYLPAVKK